MVQVMTGPTVWRALARMNDTVTTGRTGIDLEFGSSFFEVLQDDPEQGARFNRMMRSFHGAEPAAGHRAGPAPARRPGGQDAVHLHGRELLRVRAVRS
jgi:hypothetical protein